MLSIPDFLRSVVTAESLVIFWTAVLCLFRNNYSANHQIKWCRYSPGRNQRYLSGRDSGRAFSSTASISGCNLGSWCWRRLCGSSSWTIRVSSGSSQQLKKSIGHRKDPKQRRVLSSANSDTAQKENSEVATVTDGSEPPDTAIAGNKDDQQKDPDLEEKKDFQPSPATLRKARREKRRAALLESQKPSNTISNLFTSIRGTSLGRSANRR